MNEYLVPANSKKSQLILGLFRGVDIIIAVSGIFLTIVIAGFSDLKTFSDIAISVIPVLIAATLVSPMPNYHNVFKFLTNTYTYFTNRRKYLWKGWSYKLDGEERTNK